MSLPIKVAGTGIAAAITGTGIWMHLPTSMPQWSSLARDMDYEAVHGNGYVADYGRFLTGTGTPPEADGKVIYNDPWWSWSYENRYLPAPNKGWFRDLNSPEDLRNKCDEAYRYQGFRTLTPAPFREDQIWIFCSFNGKPLHTIEDMTPERSSYALFGPANPTIVAGLLLSAESENNEAIWELVDEEARAEVEKSGFFFPDGRVTGMKERCRAAYGLGELGSVDGPFTTTEDRLYRWCSVRGSK